MPNLIAQINDVLAALPKGGVRISGIQVSPKAALVIASEACPVNHTGEPELGFVDQFMDRLRTGKEEVILQAFAIRLGAVGADVVIGIMPQASGLSKAFDIDVAENGALTRIVELN